MILSLIGDLWDCEWPLKAHKAVCGLILAWGAAFPLKTFSGGLRPRIDRPKQPVSPVLTGTAGYRLQFSIGRKLVGYWTLVRPDKSSITCQYVSLIVGVVEKVLVDERSLST